jgi:hypothetical protein
VSAKATHGGGGGGAGRKPILIARQVVWIGARCDNLAYRYAERDAHRRAYAKARKRGEAAQPGMGDPVENLRLHQARLKAIPPQCRKGRHKDPGIKEISEDARGWIAAMARGKKEGFKGHVGAKLLRPKGIRERVKKKR